MITPLKLDGAAPDATTRRALTDISLAVAKSKRVVVVTGAGISCSCGIPDFRSSDGLYALVKKQYPDVVLKGRDLFDASLFRDPTSTSVFYTFISQLKRSIDSATPSPTHHFIKTLDSKKKLLRSYTQNIDGLEARAGLLSSSSKEAKSNGKGKNKINVKDVRNVQLHGDIHRVRCTFCAADFPCTGDYLDMFNTGVAPDCAECSERSKARVARSARPLKIGTLRPAIVLYDEPHPLGDDIGTIQTADISRKPDMLIIMGTSLKVHGLKKLVKDFARIVHASSPSTSTAAKSGFAGKVVFVNRTPPGSEWNGIIDYYVQGESDKWCDKVIADWKKSRPTDWQTQTTLVEEGDISMTGGLKAVKETPLINKTKPKLTKKKADEENIPPAVPMDLSSPIPCKLSARPDRPTTPGSPMVMSPMPRRIKSSPWSKSVLPSSPMVISSPVGKAKSSLPPAPLSPSKRRQEISHYSDLESSPSKKRDVIRVKGLMPPEERGLLFSSSPKTRDPLLKLDPGQVATKTSNKTTVGTRQTRATATLIKRGVVQPRP